MKQEQAIAWEDAACKGQAEPDNPWPHPDDIAIGHAAGVFSIRGPIDAEQLPEQKCLRALRDQYFVAAILQMRSRRKDAKAKAKFYVGLLGIFDSCMPTRWAFGVSGFEFMASIYLLILLKFVREDLRRVLSVCALRY